MEHVTVSAVGRSDEFWPWMSHVLLPYVHGNQSSPELGPPRLRQVRLKEGELGATLALIPALFQRAGFGRVLIELPSYVILTLSLVHFPYQSVRPGQLSSVLLGGFQGRSCGAGK